MCPQKKYCRHIQFAKYNATQQVGGICHGSVWQRQLNSTITSELVYMTLTASVYYISISDDVSISMSTILILHMSTLFIS